MSHNDLNSSFDQYADLWWQSTEIFRENHLVRSNRDRRMLIQMCEYKLDGRNCCYADIQEGSEVYDLLYYSCSYEAQMRLKLIQYEGFFRHDGSTFSDRNSIIVSASRNIIIRISPTFHPECDLHLKIEKTSIGRHLPLNSDGLIDHFKR